MRNLIENRRPFADGSHVLIACAFFVGLFTASCGIASDDGGSEDPVVGIAVTAQLSEGATVPAIFWGTQEEAEALTNGSLHFSEPGENVELMGSGSLWEVDDNTEWRSGLAIAVYQEDGSVVPGSFYGPTTLAEVVSDAWVKARGVESASSGSLMLPGEHARVQAIEFGTRVRVPSPN